MTIDEIKREIPTTWAGYKKNRKVFNDETEQQLIDYILKASVIDQRLSAKEIGKLAYQLAEANAKIIVWNGQGRRWLVHVIRLYH